MNGAVYSLIVILIVLFSCKKDDYTLVEQVAHLAETDEVSKPYTRDMIHEEGMTVRTRYDIPEGFKRTKLDSRSFQYYLRALPLKTAGSLVRYYNGATKPNNKVYSGVVDLPIGNRDLHQCADAVMRLRAEYLWNKGEYDKIHFNFTNGFRVDYSEWMQGKRMRIDGNRTWWEQRSASSNTYRDFWKYMELIFAYSGTASLEKELEDIRIQDAEIGDVLMQGGHPGHAVIIVDQAVHQGTGERIYLIAQSYMPAQELQILINPDNESLGSWYALKDGTIKTPEWTFNSADLKGFVE